MQAPDGNFYGTTGQTDTSNQGNQGTVFKITPAGTLTTLYRFCSQTNCADGKAPEAGLVLATDGNFYGTTYVGGANDSGTVFRITPAGTLTTLYSFCSQRNCTDGLYPYAGLVLSDDREFYGTTLYGGASNACISGCGTIFKITPAGKLTTHSFDKTDGGLPYAGLIQATDGNFYGAAAAGGAHNAGTIFKISPGGTLTTLYSFCSNLGCADGINAYAGLLQATNGTFYATTELGGTSITCTSGCGTVFSLSVGLAPFITFVHAAARIGQSAEILGQNFTGVTSVSFNGTPATFSVRRDTFLTATVPTGATTGYVTVTTPSGSLTSNVQFHVLP